MSSEGISVREVFDYSGSELSVILKLHVFFFFSKDSLNFLYSHWDGTEFWI